MVACRSRVADPSGSATRWSFRARGLKTFSLWIGVAVLSLLVPGPADGGAQSETGRPTEGPLLLLIPGERLSYTGDFGVLGKVGSGVLSVSDIQCVRDRPALQLAFNFRGRVMLMGIRDETSSWVDPQTMTALQYEKEERHPMGGRRERADIYPEEGVWRDEEGHDHPLPTQAPLDELSFLFLARSVRLPDGELLEIDRHFDPERNPVRIRDRGRDRIEVPAGTFDVRVIEMEVRDTSRFGGTGRVILHATDDEHRVPVRIATAMPVVGALVLVLEERSVAPVGYPQSGRSTC